MSGETEHEEGKWFFIDGSDQQEEVSCICADDDHDEDHHQEDYEEDDYESTEEDAIEWFIEDICLPESEIYSYAYDHDEDIEKIEDCDQEDSEEEEDPAEEKEEGGQAIEEEENPRAKDCGYITDDEFCCSSDKNKENQISKEGHDESLDTIRSKAVRSWPKLLAKHSAGHNSETEEEEEEDDLEEEQPETLEEETASSVSSNNYFVTGEKEEEEESRGEKRKGMSSVGYDSELDEEEDHQESKRMEWIDFIV